MADRVLEDLGALGLTPARREGDHGARDPVGLWLLVIHLLGQDEREFYRLEELWYGAKRLTPTIA